MYKKNDAEVEATFVVRVKQRPGESWHGDVAWVTGKEKQKFDSMQELFALMCDSLALASENTSCI